MPRFGHLYSKSAHKNLKHGKSGGPLGVPHMEPYKEEKSYLTRKQQRNDDLNHFIEEPKMQNQDERK